MGKHGKFWNMNANLDKKGLHLLNDVSEVSCYLKEQEIEVGTQCMFQELVWESGEEKVVLVLLSSQSDT